MQDYEWNTTKSKQDLVNDRKRKMMLVERSRVQQEQYEER